MRFASVKVAGLTAGIALLSLASAGYAQTSLTDGGGTVTTPTVTILPTGDVLIAQMLSGYSFIGTQTIAGNVASAVYSNTLGGEDFFYQFTVNNTSTAPATAFSASDFTGFTVAVGQSNSTTGMSSDFSEGGTLSTLAQLNSGTVTFNFNAGGNGIVGIGGQSGTLLVRTNAHSFGVNNGSVIGGAAANAAIFAANSIPTPEPGVLALIVPGLLGIGGMIRRRKSA